MQTHMHMHAKCHTCACLEQRNKCARESTSFSMQLALPRTRQALLCDVDDIARFETELACVLRDVVMQRTRTPFLVYEGKRSEESISRRKDAYAQKHVHKGITKFICT